MADQDPEKIREIFLQARELGSGERSAFLESACGENAGLRQEIEQLLDADSATTVMASVDPDSLPSLEGYQVLGRLGEGGMGVVWKAVQLSTHRPVALKLLSAASFGSERARLRFEREVELTAKLDHPHIARVFDSGVQHGTFFYAMQLIHGQDLDRYATAHKLSRTQIIELMELICRAVQHAHQKGVIHRDLKHSNILVDEKGEPHVLDFGLAKTMDSGQFISLDGEVAGTPAFMSPEQAAGKIDRLDTRSDVYTLGVILFHLLCGEYPHDVSGSALEVMRRISEQEPKRLGDIEPRPDKELQALLSKALEKDPSRRYASAGELADDLRRYLNHDALVARPQTLSYLLSKKMRRYRVPLTVAAAMLLLLAGVMVYAYARIFAERNAAVAARIEKESQRQEAERQRAEADRERTLQAKTLSSLRETAPTFYARSQTLTNDRKFAEALKNASYAADLAPEEPAYQRARADMLQTLYRFDEAAAAYAAVFALRPDDAIAKENVDLCRQLALEQKEKGELSSTTLSAWQSAMQRQKRFAEGLALLARVDEKERPRQEQLVRYRKQLQAAGIEGNLAIHSDLKDRRYGLLYFDPSGTDGDRRDWSALKGIPLEWANFSYCHIDDLSPLAGMPLKWLKLPHGVISDLRPLRGMPLAELYCNSAKVNDLSPLSGMPLRVLDLRGNPVSDLSPLRGALLTDLELEGTAVKDLSPLHGMPLKRLSLISCAEVEDLAPLRGMPLEELYLGGTKVRELGPLRGMKLRTLMLHLSAVSDISSLAGTPLTTLDISEANVRDIRPLRGLPLMKLQIDHAELQPAAVLRELPELQSIEIEAAEPSDLEAVGGTRVKEMFLNGNKVVDLGTLRGNALEFLALHSCNNLTDLTPLEGMPLKRLSLEDCPKLRDLRPLLKCTQLDRLSIPAECSDIEFLRMMPSIRFLDYEIPHGYSGKGSGTTAEQFWKQYDARKVSGK